MDNQKPTKKTVCIEEGTWYYFSVDLNSDGFASIQFVRYIDVNSDRRAAIAKILDKDYFQTRQIILLPYTQEPDYFKCSMDDSLSVWTFDGSKVGNAETVDLASKWPKNILDKAAITPSIELASKWTMNK